MKFYCSPHVLVEQRKRSTEVSQRQLRQVALRWKRSESLRDLQELIWVDTRCEHLRVSEEAEWSFWKGCVIEPVSSTFTGLAEMAGAFAGTIERFDTKGELHELEELLVRYEFGEWDAIHAMHAHSAGFDFLLTWDRKFIRRASKVGWLSVSVATPTTFLKGVEGWPGDASP